MSISKAAFVLVHGGWHNHSTWNKVVQILNAQGFAALTLDLPGAGVNAMAPTSLSRRPFDPAAFAAERSPMAGVTQEERTQAVVALVRDAASLCDGKVILVGHSAGGLTISAAATGATRINVGSADDAYRSRFKAAFFGDVSDSEFAHAASQLHCDEPVGAVTPSGITPGRFGTVPRHYIRCTLDRAIPLAGQDHMIATVDGAIGGKTTIHTLETSHSPFLSQPAALSKILSGICGY